MTPLGVVLAGGRSTRMGRDKATVLVGGEPMAGRVARALRAAGLEPVVAVGGDRGALAELGVAVVDDRWPGEGPLGGVLTALANAAGRDVVVVACDTPLVTADTLTRIATACADAPVVVATDGERVHPLVGRFSTTVAPVLQARFDAGVRSMHAALEGLELVAVPVDERELRNVNRPSDLSRVESA